MCDGQITAMSALSFGSPALCMVAGLIMRRPTVCDGRFSGREGSFGVSSPKAASNALLLGEALEHFADVDRALANREPGQLVLGHHLHRHGTSV